jgi:hypothetical protein
MHFVHVHETGTMKPVEVVVRNELLGFIMEKLQKILMSTT